MTSVAVVIVSIVIKKLIVTEPSYFARCHNLSKCASVVMCLLSLPCNWSQCAEIRKSLCCPFDF